MTRRILLLLIVLLALPLAAERRRAVRSPELYPHCAMITGTAAVTFTRDEGRTLAPSSESLQPIAYTYGLAALDDDSLIAWHRDDLLVSTDAGCSWRVVATIPGADFPPTITAAPGGRAYAWSDNRSFLVRYDSRGAVPLKPPADLIGFGVDALDGDHVRAGGSDGSLWESLDAGETWSRFGALEGAPLYYRFTFDPMNLDHILAGTLANGAYVTRDAGRTWTRAMGIAPRTANVFQLVFSPANTNRVWAMGIDMDYTQDDPAHGRHIFLSDDGGNTYRAVVAEAPGVKLINGPVMAPHPTNAAVLYFVFGTHIFQYGTDVFRYDLSTNALTLTHNGQNDVNAIAFSQRDPNVMYLGLEKVE